MAHAKPLVVVLAAAALSLAATAVGILVAATDLAPYLQFPPRDVYVYHAPYSPNAALLYFAAFAAIVFFFFWINDLRVPKLRFERRGAFPKWGHLGIALVLGGWLVAWTRIEIFAPIQKHTFLILWTGFIVVANAICAWVSGGSPLTTRTKHYLALFPASAAFWWFFELLNRAVQNWHYLGVEDFTAAGYFLFASLSFATVLPAVDAVHQLLQELFPDRTFSRQAPVQALKRSIAPWVMLILALSVFALLGNFPNLLFAFVWVAPLLVLEAFHRICGVSSFYEAWAEGTWRETCLWALAALVCGFFWEMWNFLSLAKWIYLVPFVDAAKVFEMPALGYAGYLPFGVFCGAVIRSIRKVFAA